MSSDEFERVRPEIRALIERGNVTVEENESIRCNSWEREALVPVLTDEAFCKMMQHALDNCFTRRERPFTTYNQAVEGLYAPELLKRFGQARAALIAAEGTYQEVLVILRVLVPMLPRDARAAVQELIDEEGKEPGTSNPTCRACSIEAEIGTEENPHPVPERFHTCPPVGAHGRRP